MLTGKVATLNLCCSLKSNLSEIFSGGHCNVLDLSHVPICVQEPLTYVLRMKMSV